MALGFTSKTAKNLKRDSVSIDSDDGSLISGVLTSPADAMLKRAIRCTLCTEPGDRATVLEKLVGEIEAFMSFQVNERLWTCRVFSGTDGSRIFRGGVGHSLVIDRAGRLWRARTYEDFETTYVQSGDIYEIASLTPVYEHMRACVMSEYRGEA
jgi:hypothetical protein